MAREIDFTFPLKNGMHARPASRLQEVANRYRSRITFLNRRTATSANAKSTLSLVASVTREGDPCRLVTDGEDEQEAHEALSRFLSEVFPACDEDLPLPTAREGARELPRALRGEQEHVAAGAPAAKGIARGTAMLLSRSFPQPPAGGWPKGSDDEELARFRSALHSLEEKMRARLSLVRKGVEQEILKAHLSIVEDPDVAARVEQGILEHHRAVGDALIESARHFGEILASSGSIYLEERVLDIQDVTAQLLKALYGDASAAPPPELPAAAVCVAENLPPSEFMALDRSKLKGLVLAHGGMTSHTVILARSLGIPCVTGVSEIHRTVKAGEELIVDGDRGLIVRAPSDRAARFYAREIARRQRMNADLQHFAHLPGVSADGRRLEVAGNAATADEVRSAVAQGAEGIGLFRTEMLFMDREKPPDEEEQYAVYARAAESAAGTPVIIRTLDIGGDKPIPYLNLPPEENPFLGYRAVRMYGDFPEIIDTQLRAILRASAHGKVRIMFPMVCSLQEVRAMKERIAAAMRELDGRGQTYDRQLPVGIMVEIPSVAFIIDQLCREVDFFSIGSNDLTQYFLAADRANPKVSGLYSPFHPAFLRLLKQIIDGAREGGRWVGLCGEMGGNPLATPLFLAYGIDEISLSPPLVPAVKKALHGCRLPECKALLERVMSMESPEDVECALKAFAVSPDGGAMITEGLVELSSESGSKEEAIRELIDLLDLEGRADDPDRIEDAVWAREATYPTGMGYGVAIPHCKSPHVRTTSLAVLRLKRPVFWKEPDEDPVQLMILIAVSADVQGDQHLRIIASLARKLMHEEFREALMSAADAKSVTEILGQVA